MSNQYFGGISFFVLKAEPGWPSMLVMSHISSNAKCFDV